MKKTIPLLFLISLSSLRVSAFERAMWIWQTDDLLALQSERNLLINECHAQDIHELFLYAHDVTDTSSWSDLRTFISNMTCQNIKVWAMDGYRGYFSDWHGPQGYYDFVNGVLDYNNTVSPNERFFGVHGDNEPQDGQGEPLSTFHNGLADSQLNTTSGGLWGDSEKEDRQLLMADWIQITETAFDLCHGHGLLYGQATPSWVDDYFGEPVSCIYKGVQDDVMHHLAKYLDVYIIMSYNTNPNNVINRISGELEYISQLPENERPQLFAAGETHCDVGANISYCDTPGKQSKTIFFDDVAVIEDSASTYAAYTGFAIHDWLGWKNLSPSSNDYSNAECTITALSVQTPNMKPTVYPNPTKTGIFTLSGTHNWHIYNSSGLLIKSGHTRQIDLSSAPNGIYLLKTTYHSLKLIRE